MASNVTSEASLSTRATSWFSTLPFMTSAVFVICVTVYVIGLLVGFDDYQLICMAPHRVIGNYELWRAFSSTIFHGGVLHIAFNMLSYIPLGAGLERLLGSVRYIHSILLFAATNAVLHLLAALVAAYNPFYDYREPLYECSIGFSGILFALIVVETHISGVQNRSIFGFFSVPAKWYPWALLLVFQLLMPGVSLLGHLSGLLSGVAYISGWLNWLLLSGSISSSIENSSLMGPLVRRPNFIVGGSNTAGNLPTNGDASSGGSGGGLSGLWRSVQGWSPLPSSAPPTEQALNHFPGRGRTLGGPPLAGGGGVAQTPPPAVPRRMSGGGANGKPPPYGVPTVVQLPKGSSSGGLKGRPEPLVGIGRARSPLSGQTQVRQETERGPSQGGAEKDALSSLVDMGFERGAASSALQAANGDVDLAVTFLTPP